MQRIAAVEIKENHIDYSAFQKVSFKNQTMWYNSNGIVINGKFYGYDVERVIIADNTLYLQTLSKYIYCTSTLVKFSFFDYGEIIGQIQNSLIYKQDKVFLYYNNKKVKKFGFYLENNIIVLTYDLSLFQPIILDYVCYQNFFVVFSIKAVYFTAFNETNNNQFVFDMPISSFSLYEIENIEFLLVTYRSKDSDKNCLFYLNQVVARNVAIKYENSKCQLLYSIPSLSSGVIYDNNACFSVESENISKLLRDTVNRGDIISSKSELNSINTFRNCSKLYNSISNTANCNIYFEFENDSNQYTSRSTAVKGIFSVSNQQNRIFSLNSLEMAAFEVCDNLSKQIFLKNYFLNYKTDIFSNIFTKLVKFSPSVSYLIDLISQCTDGPRISLLNRFKHEDWFYERLSSLKELKATKKAVNKAIKCTNKNSAEIEKILNRSYTRVFNYSEKYFHPESLAFKIINLDKKFFKKLDADSVISELYENPNRFLKLIQKLHGSNIAVDILNMFFENSILLQADVTDLNNYRQTTFLQRVLSNIGLLIINPNIKYFYSKEVMPIKVNSTNFLEKISTKNLFFYTACVSPFFSATRSIMNLTSIAQRYSKTLSSDLSDDDIENFVLELSEKNTKMSKFLLLVLSNVKKTEKKEKSIYFNKILKSFLGNKDLNMRLTSIVSLAKFNYQSNDQTVIDLLLKEISRTGPVDLKKNNTFFDQNYRNIAAISLSLIATKPFFVKTNFTFVNLLVLGLTSIGQQVDPVLFERSENSSSKEIFYSVLFTLLTKFTEDPLSVLKDILTTSLSTENSVYSAAAKFFYIGLYICYHPEYPSHEIVLQILKFAEEIEDQSINDSRVLVLFNYALIAVSIIKSGTCDITILRILRRQFLNSKNIKKMQDVSYFDKTKKCVENLKGIDQDSMQFYKICIGLVCANFGLKKLKKDAIKQLIVTFFMSKQVSSEFSFYDILRTFIINSLEVFDKNLEDLKVIAVNHKIEKKKKKIMTLFEQEFFNLSEIDRKYTIDVLSDYFENHKQKNDAGSIFDLKILGLLLLNAK